MKRIGNHRLLSCVATLVLALAAVEGRTQEAWHALEAGPHAVGFQLLELRDTTRYVSATTARRVRVYVWYPTDESDGPRLTFGDYATLADGDAWPSDGVAPGRDRLSYARHVLSGSLAPEALERLHATPLQSVEDAAPLPGPFPFIVLGQGLNYESPIAHVALCEYLAGRGFVVVTTPLVGTHTAFVKLDARDLESQVRDLELAAARAGELPFVRAESLGVAGFDMGGMAGLILTMRNPSVDAFASFESGVVYPHPSGLPAASADYAPLRLRVPWLHVDSGRAPRTRESLLDAAWYSERHRLIFRGLSHVDATSYALIEGREGRLGFWAPSSAEGVERHRTVALYLFHFFNGILNEDSVSRGAFATARPGVAVHSYPASPPTITYASFVEALLNGEGDAAIADVRALREWDPSSALLDDDVLYRLAYTLLYRWGLPELALRVGALNVELHPSSGAAVRGMSMAYVDQGDPGSAIEVYERFLERNPGDEDAERTLEWLRGQLERAPR